MFSGLIDIFIETASVSAGFLPVLQPSRVDVPERSVKRIAATRSQPPRTFGPVGWPRPTRPPWPRLSRSRP